MTQNQEQGPARTCWITWERHQRSRSLTTQLQIPLLELAESGGRLKRYVKSSWQTVRHLARGRYDTVYVQVPSIVLGCLAILLSGLLRYRVVADAHNAVLEGAEQGGWPLRSLYRFIVRHAALLIVTNAALAERVVRLGGRPVILPDPVPPFRGGADPAGAAAKRVVVISTWAADEPLAAILQAADKLPADLALTITGRPRGEFAALARASSRVQMTGFVSDADYIQLLRDARIIVDLTTREDCLVCGAYEALAVGRPLLVSDTRALRELLREGAMYCANAPDDIAAAVSRMNDAAEQWAANCVSRREAYLLEWRAAADNLLSRVQSVT